jgi:autotransporter-associated beta strand protein
MNVTKSGAGTQTFTATQTYTGGTNVNAGTLALGHATNTLADSGAVAVGGGTLALGANNDTVGAVTLTSGSITGTGTLSGSSYDVRSGTVSAILGGSGGLTKSTAGTVTLSGTNNYSGATVVNGGVLELIGTGSVNNTSGITVDGGLFKNNSSVAITQPLTFTYGTIGGTNLSGVYVSVGTSQTLSPGNSPGTMTTGATTFADGGTYVWEINNATVGGQGTKWDLLVADSLTISAGTAGFTVNIVSLVDSTNVAGNATAFDPEVNSYFLFANTASEIASFSSTAFAVNTSGFSNTFTGTWTIKRGDDATIIGGDNTELYVSYAPIPEPSAYAVLVGLGAIGLTLSRRRRRQHN